jgi:hypothetical protein
MRLLHIEGEAQGDTLLEISLCEFIGHGADGEAPPYAILSHTSLLSTATTIPAYGQTIIGQISSTLSQSTQVSRQTTQYEYELEASRVYRKAWKGVDDVSVRRSVAISHAWSALSDISLSDISALSVVALPLFLTEITNAYHYSTRSRSNNGPGFGPSVQNLEFPELTRPKSSLGRSHVEAVAYVTYDIRVISKYICGCV